MTGVDLYEFKGFYLNSSIWNLTPIFMELDPYFDP